MLVVLFHDLKKVTSYYGNIPNGPYGPETHSETYRMRDSDRDLLDDDLVDPINKLCGSLLGPYDVDFLDARQCRLLTAWLETRLTQPIDPRLAEIYHKLDDYARQAIRYNTGIVIEL